jgi:hypothetical protein
MNKESNNRPKATKWLQNARYKRLNSTIQAKTFDIVDSTESLVFHHNIKAIDIESSGLSSYEMQMIQDWHLATITGSQALIAIYNHRYHNHIANKLPHDQDQKIKNLKPIDLLSLSISFPSKSLSIIDRKIYQRIFAKSPKLAIQDTLELIKEKSMEKSLKLLTIEQVNLALKQIELDHLISNLKKPNNESSTSMEKENYLPNEKESEETMLLKDDEKLYYQVMIELVKLHLQSSSPSAASTTSLSTGNTSTNPLASDHIFDFLSKSSGKIFPSKASEESHQVDTCVLGAHLMTPLPMIQEQCLHLSIEALESTNSSYKPYLRHLASLKYILSHQVKDLEDSKAYLALGVEKDVNENTLKKAYRNLAVKLHPDKPGGNTAKFQQLQDYYQEIMKTRSQREKIHERYEAIKVDPSNLAMMLKTNELLNQLWSYVEQIQNLTTDASKIHQRYAKFLKKVQKKSKKSDSDDASLVTYIQDSWPSLGQSSSLMTICETMCEQGQQFASLAMTLPNIHARYGVLITSSTHGSQYLRDIESMMGHSLDILRFVADLMSSEHNVTAEYRVIKLMSALTTYHAIMKKALHLMMTASLTSVQIYSFVQGIIDRMEESWLEEVKQEVKLEEEFHGFSPEDQEILRQRRQPPSASQASSSSESTSASTDVAMKNESEESKEGGQEDAAASGVKDDESSKETEEEPEAGDGESKNPSSKASQQLDELKSRIHSLQMKLHVQNIQIFQSLNHEVRDLQAKLQQEVLDLMKSWDDSSLSASKQTIFALLAECIDRSLANMNTELGVENLAQERCLGLFQQHLGWMLELQGSYKLSTDDLFIDKRASDGANPHSSLNRIALLPDYRSKALWLASLMDRAAVIEIMKEEMSARLMSMLQSSAAMEEFAELAATRFCDLVSQGVEVVAVSAGQTQI